MPIKSILLHLANDPGHDARLQVALDLARRHDAALRALFAEPTGRMPEPVAGRAFSYAFVSESRAAAREAAAHLSQAFSAGCAREGIEGEWVDEPGEPLDLIARHALLSDLVIVGCRPDERGLESEVFEGLPPRVPCPVLTIPQDWSRGAVGRRILVAWKAGLPAARALRGALPMLRLADKATVLTVGSEAEQAGDVVRYLGLHGVQAHDRRDYGDERDAGEVILGVAGEIDADLVVMGCYSRSRFREMILGGATRHVVTRMRVPTLFAH